ncbi:MAG: hypothetical protein HQ568_06280 [Calditrichaeota bacterium]|nr:hypothetical protein [Calditrichota bacterium]
MAISTNIKIAFLDDDSLKPRFIFNSGDSTSEVSKQRWVQFLVLLTYHKLTNINDGWVSLEDIRSLSTFRKLRPETIGKYISQSLDGLSQNLQYFINKHLNDINTIGPYKLLIKPTSIIADTSIIETYLKQISTGNFYKGNDNQDLWQASKKTYSDFSLSSSRKFTEAYIKRMRRSGDRTLSNLALAYIKLAEIERRCNNRKSNPYYAIEKAKNLCSKIKQSGLRNIILSYALSARALSLDFTAKNRNRVLELIDDSLDLVHPIQYLEPDKLCLTAGRYYHKSHISLRLGDMKSSQDAFVKAMTNYRRMQESGLPEIVNCEPGIIEGSTLQSIITQRVRKIEHYGNEELCWYYEMLENGETSNFLTLSIGEWLTKSIIVTHEYDEAVEFLGDCLISHADLHETTIYKRLVTRYREYKNIIQKYSIEQRL